MNVSSEVDVYSMAASRSASDDDIVAVDVTVGAGAQANVIRHSTKISL